MPAPPEPQTTIAWKDLDVVTQSPMPMIFWLKPLPAEAA